MKSKYKLPRCWLEKAQTHDGETRYIAEEEVNRDCVCSTPMEAFWCMEGHLTECHKGMSCSEAECSHLVRYEE